MEPEITLQRKESLKRRLLREVSNFNRRDRQLWKAPVVEVLRHLQALGTQGVFFGGTLRSLLVGSLFDKKLARPRDIDIVVSGATVEVLETHFRELVVRKTRFGGLQLRRNDWQFDLWPLQGTWAFVHDLVENPDFALLPETTFFNLEAIAVEIWPRQGAGRRIFSGNDQFFEGIITKTLEINREENPFPELCVVRALVMASNLNFQFGPHLAQYIASRGSLLAVKDLEEIQAKHYGALLRPGGMMRNWINCISEKYASNPNSAVQLSFAENLSR